MLSWAPLTIVCAGQSNMVSTTPKPVETAGAAVAEWKPDSTPETLSRRPTSVTAFACAAELARLRSEMVDYALLATSGTSIMKWRKGGPQWVRKVEPAFAARVRPRAVFWWQGESDLDEAHLYAARLVSLVAEWRDAFEAPGLPFVAVKLWGGPEPYADDEAALRLAFESAASATSGLRLVDVSDLPWARHPTNDVRREVARRAAVAIHAMIKP